MEYAEGGELFNYIFEKKYLSEDESRKIFHQIIDAIYYLHQMGICHRDLKLENILFSSNKKDYIKIIDFGLSNLYLTGVNSDNPALSFGADFLETPCGSPGYVPPEMILGCKYDGLLTDIWSSGIILYSMLFGCLPFDDSNEDKLFAKIIRGEFYFPSNINISDEAKLLIKKILVVNPRLRADIKEIRRDPWFLIDYNPILGLYISIRDIPVSNKIIEELKKYGFNENEIIYNIKTNRHNKITTFYYLLVNKYTKNGIETENDLISDTYNEYIKQQDLKNKLIKKGEKPISLKIMKYNSESLLELKEEKENDISKQNFDLEYFKSLIEEKNLMESKEKNDKENTEINENKTLEKDKKLKSIKKEEIKNNIDKNIISRLKSQKEKITDLKININKNHQHGKIIKDFKENINSNFRGEKSLKSTKNKILESLVVNKYSYSTSINKKRPKNVLNDENKIKLSYKNKKSYKLEIEEYHKKSNEKKSSTKKNRDIISNKNKNSSFKISKLSINKNNIHININSISNNKTNYLINKDILNTINNKKLKINKINKIKNKNIKNFKNNLKKFNYFDKFNKEFKSRNYFQMEIQKEIKTSRHFKNKYILKSSSNSKSKSSKSKSVCVTENNISNKNYTSNISKNKNQKKKRIKYSFNNIKINPLIIRDGNKYSSLDKENFEIIKTNSIPKSENRNKTKSIENKLKKLINSNKNIEKKSLKPEKIQIKKKTNSLNKKDNDNKKIIKKLELNKINNNLKYRNKKFIIDDINSNFNQLTERNNNHHINNIINNKKYDFILKDINDKKIKNFSSNLQKIIPSLKGLAIKEKNPLINKSLNNLMSGFRNQTKFIDKRKSNNEIIEDRNRDKKTIKLDKSINKIKNKELNQNNNKANNIYKKIRKISPINRNKRLIKSLISNNINSIIENNKKNSVIKRNNIKINPIKIKEIKTIKINNIPQLVLKPKTYLKLNNLDNIDNIKFKNKFYTDFNNNLEFNLKNEKIEINRKNHNSRINLKKLNYKNCRNIDEILINILTKNKINVIKTENNEYICKKGNSKIKIEINKFNNLDNYNISFNNINTNQKEFEGFKKQIINILNND